MIGTWPGAARTLLSSSPQPGPGRHSSRPLILRSASFITVNSVGDPVRIQMFFRPPGSGSIRQRYGSAIRILSFSHKDVERTEIMLAK